MILIQYSPNPCNLKTRKTTASANYRPKARLSICYKLLERLLYNIIYDSIYPCRKSRVSITKSQITCEAFVVISAAYDTVWFNGLILKRKKAILCLKSTRLLANMLKNGYIKMKLGQSTSKSYSIQSDQC